MLGTTIDIISEISVILFERVSSLKQLGHEKDKFFT
jgi:hypothetical protein